MGGDVFESDLSYAGEVRVPTPADPSAYSWPEQGLKLGRQIGKMIISTLNKQYDEFGAKVDVPITQYRKAKLIPPPYKQVIGFSRGRNCKSLLDPKQCPESR